jgi:hypothetical protein
VTEAEAVEAVSIANKAAAVVSDESYAREYAFRAVLNHLLKLDLEKSWTRTPANNEAHPEPLQEMSRNERG